ncbi:MAG: PQQ-dependent sugar dehydrogenase [Gammaproteobacteria bacterium]|nr:PQQ-dependent sugar dehydrogenase [Gammaproteobacteria bacterium]
MPVRCRTPSPVGGISEAVKRLRAAGAGIVIALSCAAGAAAAAPRCDEPAGADIPAIALQEWLGGFEQPVHLAHAGDGSGRLYVVEQAGRIRVIEDGKVRPDPLLDIRRQVTSGGEKGLLSVAFHPRHADNGYFYVDYTARDGGLHTVVSRFTRGADGRADPASERVLLRIAQPYGNHNGGQLAFGPDGHLYIGMGDGGSANDPHGHGQNLATLLGALLRIDVDRAEGGAPYGIPADNPFRDVRGARPEIWAYGLRNPWRFSFDSVTGILYLGDVGQDRVEEIDAVTAGANLGWSIMEGDRCNAKSAELCRRGDLAAPIATYGHDEGIAVTGGHVYRGRAVPGLCGVYLYADYGSGRVWGLRYRDGRVQSARRLLDTDLNVSSFGQGPDGEVYLLDLGGRILRVARAE